MFFQAIPLPFLTKDYLPLFNTEQIEFHYDKHYLAYIKNLNDALARCTAAQHKWSIVKVLTSLNEFPEELTTKIKNNGGGFFNHTLFWKVINTKKNMSSCLSTSLLTAINSAFASFDELAKLFQASALNLFGSGWTWLVLTPKKELQIISTKNQDCPLIEGLIPLFGIDLWEHSYYLQYKNLKGHYLDAAWKNIDWSFVAELYSTLISKSTEELTDMHVVSSIFEQLVFNNQSPTEKSASWTA